MSGDQDERPTRAAAWRRVGTVVLVIARAAGLIALGLVLTGIIAEPETLLVNIGRLLFGK